MAKGLKDAWLRWDADWRQTWVDDLSAPGARTRARFDMNVFDHGVLRRFWTNFAEVAPGVYRSNQPSPRQIRKLAAMGIRTIINFRGESNWGSYLLEKETCEALGIRLIDHRLRSRMAPPKGDIRGALAAFDAAERPFLMHCKSGADRAGLAAAVYLLDQGVPAREAARQLSLRHLHIKAAKTGVLDAFIEAFARFQDSDDAPFRDWFEHHYDPAAVEASFKASGAGSFLVDRILNRE